jgi:hypothetical protein
MVLKMRLVVHKVWPGGPRDYVLLSCSKPERKIRCISPLNAEFNPICHFLALLGGATIVVVSRLRVNYISVCVCVCLCVCPRHRLTNQTKLTL